MMIQEVAQGVIVSVHVQPKAARTAYMGVQGDALKFRIMAPPLEGAANDELCRFLASAFGVSVRDVMIHSGHHGRRKRVLVKHLDGNRLGIC